MNRVSLAKISEFIQDNDILNDLSVDYWYQGYCPQTGQLLRLPRTKTIEAIALGLMAQLSRDDRYSYEGKMYGVLLVETSTGELRVIKAFSGLLLGKNNVEGWVPCLLGKEKIALEELETLEKLEAIKQQIITLKQLPQRQQYQNLCQEWETRLQNLAIIHQQKKQKRQKQREYLSNKLEKKQLKIAFNKLDLESQKDGITKRNLKKQKEQILKPLKEFIEQKDDQIFKLKLQRKELSRQLQKQMHQVYSLTNFAGQSTSLQDLISAGLPTGTGECCAPKLLNYAAKNNLKPLAMAEFWWGKASKDGDKRSGQFYPACPERCQPIMGFLLSGLSLNFGLKENHLELDLIYQDQWIIAVNKPAGLLSVPGRYYQTFDSVLTRLQNLLPEAEELMTVHRLDQETSGILLLARDRQTQSQLSQQFEQRKIEKIYEAILAGSLVVKQGVIELPLGGDPNNRPYQKVDWKKGKPSTTYFQIIAQEGDYTRVQFIPLTGRTHQIRIHAVDQQGLGVVILGDRLYGCSSNANRLHLHAKELKFEHPQLQKTIKLHLQTPF
ncbi:MAG TPA: RNA pseudouridine synthase [Cyanothece sp. UBA12306]|nr:RNA pseudouridine synthase [Cyanothece sp. UBA12306]